MTQVRCNNCGWTGDEDDLVIFEEDGKYGDGYGGKGCPNCKTDAYLADVEPAPAKHTPGPWVHIHAVSSDKKATRWEQTHWIQGPETDQSKCTSICDISIWDTSERQIANARLIAAAPDLLEACIKARDLIDHEERVSTIRGREILIAAIAKAGK